MSETYVRGPLSTVSRKDLRNVASYLYRYGIKKDRNYTHLRDRVANLLLKAEPIPLANHKKGASHKSGIGPARSPIKCYKYMKEFFKVMDPRLASMKGKLSRILVQSSTAKRQGGYRRASRGRVVPEERRLYRINLCYTS